MLRRPRGATGAVLTATGRDISEAEYAMNFDGTLGQWVVTGQGAEASLKEGSHSSAILAFMKNHPGIMHTAQEVVEGLDNDFKSDTVKRELGRLAVRNIIQRDKGKFAFFIPSVSPVSLAENHLTKQLVTSGTNLILPCPSVSLTPYNPRDTGDTQGHGHKTPQTQYTSHRDTKDMNVLGIITLDDSELFLEEIL